MKITYISKPGPGLLAKFSDQFETLSTDSTLVVQLSDDKGRLVAQVLLSPSTMAKKVIIVEAIRFLREKPGPDLHREVLKACRVPAMRVNAQKLVARVAKTAGEIIDPTEEFLRDCFREVPVLDRFYAYTFSDIFDENFICRDMPVLSTDPALEFFDRLGNIKLRLAKLRGLGAVDPFYSNLMLNSSLSMFYLDGLKVLGALLAKRQPNGVVLVDGIFSPKGSSHRRVFYTLMAGLFSRASVGEGMTQNFLIHLAEQRDEALLFEMLGSGGLASRVREFEYQLKK